MGEFVEIPLSAIITDPSQPRRRFDQDKIMDLAKSIKQEGLLQPILVRPKGDKFMIVHGERRFQAHKLACFQTIRAEVRELTDEEALIVQLIENVQREDLNPVEEAETYRRMVHELGFTHEVIAEKIGKSRAYVTNRLRLLGLPHDVQEKLRDGTLSQGHAEAILSVGDEEERNRIAKRIVEGQLSVKQSRELIKASGRDVNVRRLTSENVQGIIDNLAVLKLVNGSGSYSFSLGDVEQALINDLKTVRRLRLERL